MATNKRVFTLRLEDEVFDKIGALATKEHRSMTNYIEYVLLKHIAEVEKWLRANFHHRNCWNIDEFCVSLRTYFGIEE